MRKTTTEKFPCCYRRIFLIGGCLIAGFLCTFICIVLRKNRFQKRKKNNSKPYIYRVLHMKYIRQSIGTSPFGQRNRRGGCPTEHRGEFPSVSTNEHPTELLSKRPSEIRPVTPQGSSLLPIPQGLRASEPRG